MTGRPTLVVGIGNPYRSDDRAGLAVLELLRAGAPADVRLLELEGEPIGLLDAWEGAEDVLVVDAVASGREPGSVVRFDAIADPPPAAFRARGTHTFSLGDVVGLARSLGRLPERLELCGIEGDRFVSGTEMSPRVEAAVAAVARALLEEWAEPPPPAG